MTHPIPTRGSCFKEPSWMSFVLNRIINLWEWFSKFKKRLISTTKNINQYFKDLNVSPVLIHSFLKLTIVIKKYLFQCDLQNVFSLWKLEWKHVKSKKLNSPLKTVELKWLYLKTSKTEILAPFSINKSIHIFFTSTEKNEVAK